MPSSNFRPFVPTNRGGLDTAQGAQVSPFIAGAPNPLTPGSPGSEQFFGAVPTQGLQGQTALLNQIGLPNALASLGNEQTALQSLLQVYLQSLLGGGR